MIYIENPKESEKKKTSRIIEFRKVTEYKIKSLPYFYIVAMNTRLKLKTEYHLYHSKMKHRCKSNETYAGLVYWKLHKADKRNKKPK